MNGTQTLKSLHSVHQYFSLVHLNGAYWSFMETSKGKIMNKADVTEAIILAKKAKNLSWEAIASELDMGTVWVTSACLGMNSMPKATAEKLCSFLGLGAECVPVLAEYPTKAWTRDVPQDPLIYRLYEIV